MISCKGCKRDQPTTMMWTDSWLLAYHVADQGFCSGQDEGLSFSNTSFMCSSWYTSPASLPGDAAQAIELTCEEADSHFASTVLLEGC